MKFYIQDTNNKELASISVNEGGSYSIDFKDKRFEFFLNSKISEGIKVFDEKHEGDVFVATTKTISEEDKNLGYAILDFLRYNGYIVNTDTENLKKKIETILASFPEDDSRKEILDTLPKLNYLEATFLLGELKNKNN